MPASARSNITNRQQDQLEEAEFDGGVPVFKDGSQGAAVTRIIAKGLYGSPEKVAYDTTNRIGSNAGVVMNPSDHFARFEEALIGKS